MDFKERLPCAENDHFNWVPSLHLLSKIQLIHLTSLRTVQPQAGDKKYW